MTDALRGLVLLVSVVLWLPVLRPVLSGEMTTAEGAVRYAGALILAWGGVSLLATVVKGYSSPDRDEAPSGALAEEARPANRAEDATE